LKPGKRTAVNQIFFTLTSIYMDGLGWATEIAEWKMRDGRKVTLENAGRKRSSGKRECVQSTMERQMH